MSTEPMIKRLISFITLGVIASVIAACGGGGGGTSQVTTSGSGDVALLLTDAPSDQFEEVNITVVKAELLSDNGRHTLFEGERTFNLLELTDAEIFAIREGVPVGTYSKVRLTLSDMELVDYNGTDDPADDLIYHPKLPGNGKLDLNPRGDFDVNDGDTLVIQIDMDANKSIHVVKKGNKDEYQFRPVVFVDIDNDAFEERFVKLHGIIEDIDREDQTFELCDGNIPVQIGERELDEENDGCVYVATKDDTSIFDINGMPARFSDLIAGEEATVFGRLRRETEEEEEEEDEDEHEMDDLVLVANLIELGPLSAFTKLTGTTTSVVDNGGLFEMDVDPGQGLATPLILGVQIQEGTKLINRSGNAVDVADIMIGELVKVRGVLDVDTDTLYASHIVVDTETTSLLSGTVGSNPDGSCGFSIITDAGDRSVATNSGTEVFLVTATDSLGASRPGSAAELTSDQAADVYGEFINGCFEADTIIAYELN